MALGRLFGKKPDKGGDKDSEMKIQAGLGAGPDAADCGGEDGGAGADDGADSPMMPPLPPMLRSNYSPSPANAGGGAGANAGQQTTRLPAPGMAQSAPRPGAMAQSAGGGASFSPAAHSPSLPPPPPAFGPELRRPARLPGTDPVGGAAAAPSFFTSAPNVSGGASAPTAGAPYPAAGAPYPAQGAGGGGSPYPPTSAGMPQNPLQPPGPLNPSQSISSITMPVLLRAAIEKGASDLHISAGLAPTTRVDGYLQPLPAPALSAEDCRRLVYSILNNDQKAKFEANWELDLSLELDQVGRFRVNIHRQRGSTEAAFRVVNDVIQPIRRLGLPPVVEDLARRDSGLVLVTGPTGSGKTTSLAAMVDLINSERQCMIVTIEDPIEYVHPNKRSIVKQREVASDTKSFAAALRHVLRQDPDVIVVGEMRDLETISTALTAAETGHLVLATLHTPDAAQTIDRVVDVFSSHQQQQVRIQLANCLEGIVSQQLLPIPGGRGRVIAVEVLIATTAIRKIIRGAKTEQVASIIQTSWDLGMITMDRSLKNLYSQGLITYDDAIAKCRYPENFDQI